MQITVQFRKKVIDFKERLSEEDYELTFEDKVFMRYLVSLILEVVEIKKKAEERGSDGRENEL